MRILHDIEAIFEASPVWLRVLLLVFFVLFSFLSIYGRLNLNVGSKLFARIPRQQIRTNLWHISTYTVIPVVITAVYCGLFLRWLLS